MSLCIGILFDIVAGQAESLAPRTFDAVVLKPFC